MWKLFKKKSAFAPPSLKLRRASADKAAIKPAAVAKEPVEVVATKPSLAAASRSDSKTRSSRAHAVFIKPLVSEKSAHGSVYDTYVFVVKRETNKVEVAKAFWAMYNIKPVFVRTLLMPEKRKRVGRGRRLGVRPAWKKALIRVPKGSKVDIFAGV